jgi:hypothetical protein
VKPGAAKAKRMEKKRNPSSAKSRKRGWIQRQKTRSIQAASHHCAGPSASYRRRGGVILFAPEHVPEQLAFLKAARKTETTDPGVVRLRFTSVTGSFVQNAKAGQVFVVRGAISNNYNSNRSHVLVKGSILDDKGKVVKTKVAYAGNVFAESELQSLSMEQIDQGLRNRTGKENANVNIKPQASVPFMIVFEELPDNLSEFTVEPVSSSPGQ